MIPDEFLYEYATVRFVPRVHREEFVNIGLIMMCKRRKWLKGLIRIDELRLKSLFPSVNIVRVEQQASLFMRDDAPSIEMPVEERYRWLTAVKSAVLQVSPSHPGIIKPGDEELGKEGSLLLEREFERLFKELVM